MANQILVKFKPEGHEKLIKAINRLSDAQSRLRKSGGLLSTRNKRLTNENNKLANSFATIRSKMLLLSFAMSLGVKQLTDFGKQAAKVDSMRRAFGTLSGGALSASRSITKLKKATNGTMSEFDLFQQANNAMILGVSKNSDEMAEMFDIAQRLGRALGRDTASSVESLITGIGRQSRLMLDNIGIIVKSEEAYEDYAKSLNKSADELTDAEKKQAFLNATMESAREKVKTLGDEGRTSEDSFQQFQASMVDFGAAIGEFVLPAMVVVLDTATKMANVWNDFLGTISAEPAEVSLFQEWKKDVPETEEGIRAMIATLEDQRNALLDVEESVEITSRGIIKNLDPAMDNMIIGLNLGADANKNLILTLDQSTSSIDNVMETLDRIDLVETFAKPLEISADQVDSINPKIADLAAKLSFLQEKLAEFKKESKGIDWRSIVDGAGIAESAIAAVANEMARLVIEGKSLSKIKLGDVLGQMLLAAGFKAILTAGAGFASASILPAILKLFKGGVKASSLEIGSMQAHSGGYIQPDGSIQRFARGGVIKGQDNVPILAQAGEFVLSRSAVNAIGVENLNRMNQGGSSAVNITFTGNVMSQDFIENEAIPQIKDAIRRGADIGVS